MSGRCARDLVERIYRTCRLVTSPAAHSIVSACVGARDRLHLLPSRQITFNIKLLFFIIVNDQFNNMRPSGAPLELNCAQLIGIEFIFFFISVNCAINFFLFFGASSSVEPMLLTRRGIDRRRFKWRAR